MAVVEVAEEDAEVRNKWIWKIRCGDPLTGEAERKQKWFLRKSNCILDINTYLLPGAVAVAAAFTAAIHV